MRISILDPSYESDPTRFAGAPAQWLRWEALRLGAEIVEPRLARVVLVTFVAPHEFDLVPRALRKAGIEPDRIRRKQNPWVVMGGGFGLSPAIGDGVADMTCVGEGRRFVETLLTQGPAIAAQLPEAWVPGEQRPVIPNLDFPWDLPPIKHEDGIVRVFASRGCQKKCLFCQTGWATPYQETPNPDRLVTLKNALTQKGERVNLVTNDASALSFFDEVGTVEHFSASYSQTVALLDGGLRFASKVKSVRFGVESVSERLRGPLGKQIPTDKLTTLSIDLLNQGIGVRWFMIAGIPGERESDWDELRQVVQRVKVEANKGALQLSFTAFCPDPAAPLCLAPLEDSYWDRFQEFWKWFFDGPGFTRRVQLFKCAAPKGRLHHAMNSMAATEAQLRRGWLDADPPNWRIEYSYKKSARKAYAAYCRRVGLSA